MLTYNLPKADAGRDKALCYGGVPGTGLHRKAVALIPRSEAIYSAQFLFYPLYFLRERRHPAVLSVSQREALALPLQEG